MIRSARRLVFVVLVSSVSWQNLLAQNPDLPGQPVPYYPAPQQESLPPITLPRSDQGMQPQPGNTPFVPATPTFIDDPLQPVVQPQPTIFNPTGWYGMFEISLLFPDLHGFLSGPVTINGVPQTVQLGGTNLDATGSPRIEVGYRLGDGFGAAALMYRSVVAKGAANVGDANAIGGGFLSSLLNINVVDIDYASPDYGIGPDWDFAWRAGIRVAAAYYSNQVIGNIAQQQATSNFIGAGPHATLELGRSLPFVPGLAVLAKLDGAVVIGNISQSFDETIYLPNTPTVGDTTRFSRSQTVPVLTFDLGFSYTLPGIPHWARFGFGYQFEYWWNMGTSGGSHGDLGINGLYFRGEFNF